MLDVRRLGMLTALDRLGTVAEVAEELHVTAPAVSMQLGALEKEVGLTLTRRQGRRLVLTPAGRVLAERGRDLLVRLSLVEEEMRALRTGTIGRYGLATFPSAARTLVPHAYRALLQEAPALDLHLTTQEPAAALGLLTGGGVDVAVVHAYSNVPRDVPAGVDTRPIGAEPVWLAVRRDAEASRDLADHATSPWIVPTSDVTCYEMVERACGAAGFRPRVVAESMDFAVQLELVAAGVGVALVPDLTVDRVPDEVELVPPVVPVERFLHCATRGSSAADPGVVRIVETLASATDHVLSARRRR